MRCPPRSVHAVTKPVLASGQIWAVQDSQLRIGLIGKTLVHFKCFKAHMKRAPNSLTSIKDLQQFLRRHKAVLHHEGDTLPPVAKRQEP